TAATDVSRLIEEVARGERALPEIRDEKLREIVRLALRLHKDPFSARDAAARNRIRRRVMGSLRPHRPSLADRFVIAFTLLAKPTPYALRAIAVALVVVSLAGGTLVASADALPDDALYPVKIATEQVRLALATTSQDRAAVASSEPAPSGLSPAAAIAADAANTAEGVASVAEKKIAPRRTESPRSASARPAGSVPSPAVTPGRADATQSAPASAGSQATPASSRPSPTVAP